MTVGILILPRVDTKTMVSSDIGADSLRHIIPTRSNAVKSSSASPSIFLLRAPSPVVIPVFSTEKVLLVLFPHHPAVSLVLHTSICGASLNFNLHEWCQSPALGLIPPESRSFITTIVGACTQPTPTLLLFRSHMFYPLPSSARARTLPAFF